MGLRITDQGLANSRINWIGDARGRAAEHERALTTGRRIDQPSDDPAGATQILRHQSRLRRIEQYDRNNSAARLWINGGDGAMQSAANLLGRAKTLAVQAGNDTLGATENAALAADIRAISEELRTIANAKVQGRPIFAGTADNPEAYDLSGTYIGDSSPVEMTIDKDEVVVVGLPGPDVFGVTNPGDPLNGTAFEALHALADAVELGDNATVRQGIEAVDVTTARVGSAQGRIGAISRQLDAAEFRHGGEKLAVESDVSKIRDTDMAEAIVRLRSAEASYEATLAATARGISVSLLDFLR
ncbi:MAG: flagellar hook-associated protein FlgL [Actinomycetota bacterium]